ncbi:hypothetical protein J2Y69_003094 [Microbacterium resistens]|uniref:Uncharacterized protein n=1 Tax=Microbacterium resistens TaxID=156977 RepID=A0ABU1SHK9_9MICO|nr:hypothetical protein [Microbacterium resistens]MDR6868478.1 hypothetical protein [Microbacterium resistens]
MSATNDPADLKEKLAHARERLEAANDAMRAADQKNDAATAMGGGIPGFGASGSQRAARQVRTALGSAHRAWKEASERVEKWSYRVKRLEVRIAEIERPRLTREDVLGATLIHEALAVALRVYPERHHVHMRGVYADAYERGYRAAADRPDGSTER